MVGCHLHFLEGSSIHTKPLTDFLKDEKNFSNFIDLFDVPNKDLLEFHCKQFMLVRLSSRSFAYARVWLSRGVVVLMIHQPMIHSEHALPMFTRPGSGNPSNPRLRSMTSDT